MPENALGRQHWYRIVKAAKDGAPAEVYVYDEIGMWGKTAKEFVNELKAVTADVIQLHVNSPGGEYYDAVAMMNALRQHKARVVATVDGLAASAASVLIQASEEIIMAKGSEMMVHDASGGVYGNAKDMTEWAERLDTISNTIAEVYAERAGGTADEWRAVMRDETWFTAAEAVEAGLADRIDEGTTADSTTRNRFDYSVFNHAGRSDAPDPEAPTLKRQPPERKTEKQLPAAAAIEKVHSASKQGANQKGSRMDFTEEELAAIRQANELAEDAEVTKAHLPKYFESLAGDDGGADDGADDKATAAAKAPKPKAKTQGTITVDSAAWDEQQERIKRLEATEQKRSREERDTVIDQAVQDGKFPPVRKAYWAKLWDADPEGTRDSIAGLHKNVVPVDEVGIGRDSDDDLDVEFASIFPDVPNANKKGA